MRPPVSRSHVHISARTPRVHVSAPVDLRPPTFWPGPYTCVSSDINAPSLPRVQTMTMAPTSQALQPSIGPFPEASHLAAVRNRCGSPTMSAIWLRPDGRTSLQSEETYSSSQGVQHLLWWRRAYHHEGAQMHELGGVRKSCHPAKENMHWRGKCDEERSPVDENRHTPALLCSFTC
jgi:hypothetical protein